MSQLELSSPRAIGLSSAGCGDGAFPRPGWWTGPAVPPLGPGPPMPGQSVPMPVGPLPGTRQTGPAAGVDQVRCVVVDDNDRFIEFASGLLQGDGFEVVGVACDGTQALRLVAEVCPDVALIDLYLGQDDGIEVIADIVGAGLAEKMVMILVSACAEDDLRDLFRLSAADGYLAKADLSSSTIRDILHGNGNGNGHGRDKSAGR
jgi:CheY-like chemotaxis protein